MDRVKRLACKGYIVVLGLLFGLPASRPALANEYECSTYQVLEKNVPVNITDCREITSEADIFENNFYSYSAPFSLGVSIPYELSDILGLSLGKEQGTLVKALGFPEQKIDWDGTALSNTFKTFLTKQSRHSPIRTEPIGNGFCAQLPNEFCMDMVTGR